MDMTVFMTQEDRGARIESSAPIGESFETGLMARTLGGLFAAGATLALVTIALPHSSRASELGLLLIVGNAYVVGALLFWQANVIPRAILPAALAWGSTLVAGVAYFSANSPSP